MADENCRETPLLDLLRGIPRDARMTYEHGPTHHQMIPVGRLAHKASDELGAYKLWNETQRSEIERVYILLSQARTALEVKESSCKVLTQQYASVAARYHDLLTNKHCVDCCCARSWKALGITEYTGQAIHEHIADLKAELESLKALKRAPASREEPGRGG